MAPIAASDPERVRREAEVAAGEAARTDVFEGRLPEKQGPLTLAQTINAALVDLFVLHGDAVLFGEDVGRKGGVYGVTRGLAKRIGIARVFDTLLDEQTILGIALGCALAGLAPFPEIQYLAYLHNAEDQVRGEAATLAFFSNGQYHNGMVIRIAGLAYQRGFGGHFHNDNGLAVLRDIPGLVVAVPAHPQDAAALLRTCAALARVEGRVCIFLEPIARYHTRDLGGAGDDLWLAPYRAPGDWGDDYTAVGRGRVYGDGDQLTMITFGNGTYMALRVAAHLAASSIRVRILDLLWIVPLPVHDILEQANRTGRVLIVDETRRSGGVSEGVVTALIDGGFTGSIRRVTSQDSFIPLGGATEHVLLGEDEIAAAARELVEGS